MEDGPSNVAEMEAYLETAGGGADVPTRVEDLLRELAPQVLGALVRRYGDFDAAEDAVQEALLAAAVHWPRDGVPASPRGWLLQTAERRLIDQWRSDRSRRRRESWSPRAAEPPAWTSPDRDDTLTVLFMCCHPALTPASAIALTLRAVGGLTTAEIARAFLVPEATMAQRISRAKQRIKASGVPFRLPDARRAAGAAAQRPARPLPDLQRGLREQRRRRAAPGRAVRRGDPAGADGARGCSPTTPRSTGLLALMLLIDARRPARTDAAGELVPLAEQDRALWDRALIAEGPRSSTAPSARGRSASTSSRPRSRPSTTGLRRAEDTDWPQILALYGLLEQMTGNPVVTLNRAVAAAMADGPDGGLAVLDTLDERLDGHYRVDAVRAHLLELAGDTDAALAHYRAAAAGRRASPSSAT